MGARPEWYPLIRAARYLGVPPWVLAEQSYVWQEWALAAEGAEIEAQNELNKSTGT